jgi:hypothetical protein
MTPWVLDLAARPTVPRLLATSTGWLDVPYLSSDRLLVGYVATDQVGDNVYVIPFAGGTGQPVTHEAGGRYVSGWVPSAHLLTNAGDARPSPLFAQEVPDDPRRVNSIGRSPAVSMVVVAGCLRDSVPDESARRGSRSPFAIGLAEGLRQSRRCFGVVHGA